MTNQNTEKKNQDQWLDDEAIGVILYIIGGIVLLFLTAPAIALGAIFYRRVNKWYPASIWATGIGIALVAIFCVVGLLPDLYLTVWHHMNVAELLNGKVFMAVFPQLGYAWALMLPLAPAMAWGFYLFFVDRPEKAENPKKRERVQKSKEQRRLGRANRKAARQSVKVPAGQENLIGKAGKQAGLILGYRLSGEKPLPTTRKGEVLLTLPDLAKHGLVVGMPGSGKTETLLRMAYAVARHTKWQVFFLDGKGSVQTARRFNGLMQLASRNASVFPHQPFDGWQGSSEAIYSRLLEMIDWSKEGDGAYYRDVAKNIMVLACESRVGPPKSSRALLERLNLKWLKQQYAQDPLANSIDGLKEQDTHGTRVRYQGFFMGLKGLLDGGWSWDNANAGYLLLSMAQKESSASLARFLFEDFVDYCLNRKDPRKKALLIVDEFSAISEVGGMAAKVERLRECGGSVMLAAQSVEGIGDEREAHRIIAATHLKLVHRLPNPEALVRIAGTQLVPESSMQHLEGDSTGLGSVRYQHQFKINPNGVRNLGAGIAHAICAGEQEKLKVAQAPHTFAELPSAKSREWESKSNNEGVAGPNERIGYGREGLA